MTWMTMASFMVLSVLAVPIVCIPSSRIFYLLYTNAKSWNDAKMTCDRNSQSLLIEKDGVTAQVLARFNTDPEWEVYLSAHDNWIGLHRQQRADNSPYVWHDCTEIGSYSNWELGEPEGSGLCVSTSWSTGRWQLTKCDLQLPFICQKHAGSCVFDIKRGMKHPHANSGQFTTTSVTACEELCRKGVIADRECWALTYFRSNGSCFLHFSEPLIYPEEVELVKEKMADVHFKQCFKAFINPYSLHMNYSSLTPDQGCWNKDVSRNTSTLTFDVTSGAQSASPTASSSVYMETIFSNRNTPVSHVSSIENTISSHHLDPTPLSFVSQLPATDFDPVSAVENSSEVLWDSQTNSNNRMVESVAYVGFAPSVSLSSSHVFSSNTHLDPASQNFKFSETVTSSPSLYADKSELYLDPSPVRTTDLPTTHANLPNPVVESSTSGSNGSVECLCPCAPKIPENLTTDEMMELAEDIVREIKVDKNNLSSTQRKLISVTDERTSAQGIGVIGVLILCGVFGGILTLDFMTLCKAIWQLWQNTRTPSIKELQKRRTEQIFLSSFSEESTKKCKLMFDTN